MNARVTALVDEARKLTADEQQELLVRLQTLPLGEDEPGDGTPEEIEAAWAEEIDRRVAAFERGETVSVSHDEVMAQLRARLGNR